MSPVARMSDPITSWLAAESVTNVQVLQKEIARLLAVGWPLSDEDIFDILEQRRIDDDSLPQISPSGVRTRRAELVDMGYVQAHDMRGMTRAGRQCALWVATPLPMMQGKLL